MADYIRTHPYLACRLAYALDGGCVCVVGAGGGGGAVDILGSILPPPSPEMVQASVQSFDALEVVRNTGEVGKSLQFAPQTVLRGVWN